MGQRRKAREAALQCLFGLDFLPGEEAKARVEEEFGRFLLGFEVAAGAQDHAWVLVCGVVTGREAIDARIQAASTNWRISRMSAVDRNILRMAVFEMENLDDVPDRVAINEAVEIAKRYGADKSPAFINGILDAVVRQGRG